MKILYHHRTRVEDAQGIHIKEMVSAFRNLGCEVRVIGLVDVNDAKEEGIGSQIISTVTARMPNWLYELSEIFYNFYALFHLWCVLREESPDMVYERYAIFNFAGAFISKKFKIPFVLEVNAPLSWEKQAFGNLFFKKIARLSERWICSNAFKTITVTTPLKKILVKMGVPPEKICVMQNGIDYQLFRKEANGRYIRQKYGVEEKRVLGFVGWFRSWHGLGELLQSYLKYRMSEKNISIMLVGDGPAMRELQAYCEKNRIDKQNVIFTGSVVRKEIPYYISAFDICLQPDVTFYASPIKLFEYMAMGKAIIAPAKENIIEILGEDYPGLFCPGDFDHMGKKILSVTQNPQNTQLLAERVTHIMNIKQYTWHRNARKVLELLEQ